MQIMILSTSNQHKFVFGSFIIYLANNDNVIVHEFIIGNLEVERGGSFPDATRCVVMGSVAGAIVTSELSRIGNRNASQVGAHAQDDEPLRVGGALRVGLGVSETRNVHGGLSCNLFSSSTMT